MKNNNLSIGSIEFSKTRISKSGNEVIENATFKTTSGKIFRFTDEWNIGRNPKARSRRIAEKAQWAANEVALIEKRLGSALAEKALSAHGICGCCGCVGYGAAKSVLSDAEYKAAGYPDIDPAIINEEGGGWHVDYSL